MTQSDTNYHHHILDAIKRIEEYSANLIYENYLNDYLVQDGFICQLEIIDEALKRLSLATKNLSPNVPWKDIAGMRDKLIHDYFGVDLDAVWETVNFDLPILKKEILLLIE